MILLTRPLEDSIRTHAKLKALGLDVIISPLLEIKPITLKENFSKFDYLLITSSNAAKYLEGHLNHLPSKALVVGEKSASKLDDLGIKVELIGNTGKDLYDKIINHIKVNSHIIYLCGNHIAYDIMKTLALKGYPIRRRIVYKSVINKTFSPEVLIRINTVLLYSARSALIFKKFCKSSDLTNLKIICISLNVANQLKDLKIDNLLIAREPNENSMFELLND